VPPTQVPAWQVSTVVQTVPSEHGLVSSFVKTQPLAGLHESSVHALLSLQTTGEPLHAPPLHESPLVHALPSEHALASLLVKTQPVAGLQESSVQVLPSLHASAGPGAHEPPEHVSVVVHRLLSVHGTLLFEC
jgi:hypothetical protein